LLAACAKQLREREEPSGRKSSPDGVSHGCRDCAGTVCARIRIAGSPEGCIARESMAIVAMVVTMTKARHAVRRGGLSS
jgi:hypothetical protein